MIKMLEVLYVNPHIPVKEPTVTFPVTHTVSDYKWQYDCLISRLKHLETYEKQGEDVTAVIQHLIDWLMENKDKAEPGDPEFNFTKIEQLAAFPIT